MVLETDQVMQTTADCLSIPYNPVMARLTIGGRELESLKLLIVGKINDNPTDKLLETDIKLLDLYCSYSKESLNWLKKRAILAWVTLVKMRRAVCVAISDVSEK